MPPTLINVLKKYWYFTA